MRSPVRRLRAWWNRRRGRGLLAWFGGGADDPGGAGVREPRRPKQPSLSGAAAVDEPHDENSD
jgi:hypothetical protein